MSGTKQKVFCSPRLVYDVRFLRVQGCLHAFVCISWLKTMVHVPKASTYWIEASTTQWSDGSGWEVWVRAVNCHWMWGRTRQTIRRELTFRMWEGLDKMPIAQDRPVRIFFRLLYEEG